jgi:hypothetical protein
MQHFCQPAPGDRILILRQPWLDLILSGAKTLEIRSRRLARQTYFLGCQRCIYGSALVSDAFVIHTARQWQALFPQHRWSVDQKPFRTTWAHKLSLVARAGAPVPYSHPRGAIGIVLFR